MMVVNGNKRRSLFDPSFRLKVIVRIKSLSEVMSEFCLILLGPGLLS